MGTHPIFVSDFDCLTERLTSHKMALSDEAVSKQIEHMIAFIKNESQEKVEEIYAKADEEFQIEKGRLVNQQRVKIIDHYTRKEKQLEQQKRLQQSKFINDGRLKVLKARESHISAVSQTSQGQLSKISQNAALYEDMLQKLMVQATFQLLESNAFVICRQSDAKVIENLLVNVQNAYKDATAKDLNIKLHPNKSLPATSAGGIDLCNANESITISNTLEARLALITRQKLPEIREQLFGTNPNRKFRD